MNPATEEVIGVAPTARRTTWSAAIAAARRAFDTTDWATNHALPRALPAAAPRGAEGGEGGAPRDRGRRGGLAVSLTYAVQCDAPIDGCRTGPTSPRVRLRAADARHHVHGHAEPAAAAPRGGRRRRRDHAVELPALSEPLQARAGARGRLHRRAEARARHAVVRHARSAGSSPSRPTSRPAS